MIVKSILPGKISLRLTGGLLVSMVTLYMADLTGGAGFITSLMGNEKYVCVIRGEPEIGYDIYAAKFKFGSFMLTSFIGFLTRQDYSDSPLGSVLIV